MSRKHVRGLSLSLSKNKFIWLISALVQKQEHCGWSVCPEKIYCRWSLVCIQRDTNDLLFVSEETLTISCFYPKRYAKRHWWSIVCTDDLLFVPKETLMISCLYQKRHRWSPVSLKRDTDDLFVCMQRVTADLLSVPMISCLNPKRHCSWSLSQEAYTVWLKCASILKQMHRGWCLSNQNERQSVCTKTYVIPNICLNPKKYRHCVHCG